ncbi:hypothetical protein [Amycolatopsis taiwanensis]|uniref:Uncharacterized protein n=1 Tax=Amycolatopsis taiwanensis TaxID=342230 RepID=A0A9W6VGD3_9PSEU|nr:hypothetical protein [Amycolatopsis taiwanensis]GLY70658.1 hypothetical protein Atai01_72770 [Amycolatopsis taiwanensis]
MTDDLRLPPPRELPPEVRLRLREAVTTGVTARRHAPASMLAAAAAVVLLVASAVVAVQLARPQSDEAAGGGTDLASQTLDRCWAAVGAAGKTSKVPDRKKWDKASLSVQGDDVVVAFTADGKPTFCETTSTMVTMSDPNAKPAYATGTRTALLLYTSTGLAAGVADPAWDRVELDRPDGLGISVSDVTKASHQFTSFTLTDPATTQLCARLQDNGTTRSNNGKASINWSCAKLPSPPAPLFSIVDRPGDRSSRAGRALGECLAGFAQPPADQDAYQPGVLLEDGPYQVVLGRTAAHTVACTTEPDSSSPSGRSHRLYQDTFIGQSIPVRRLSVPGLGKDGAKVPFVGIVPPSGASMIADFAFGKPVDITVADGTFGIWLPAGAKPVYPNGDSWVKTLDGKGAALFNGSVPMK